MHPAPSASIRRLVCAMLHESARWWGLSNDDDAIQSEAWLRWDDPVMPASSNRFHQALAETRLD